MSVIFAFVTAFENIFTVQSKETKNGIKGPSLLHLLQHTKMSLPDSRNFEDVPLHGHVELWKIDPEWHDVRTLHLAHVTQVNL